MRRATVLKELAVIGLFLAIAVGFFVARWQGETPFVHLGGDAANVAGFAAAREAPGMFQGDEVLGDPANYEVYQALQVHLVRALARLVPDYGMATLLLLIPYAFLIGWGMYVLGRAVLQERFWAIQFGLFNLVLVLLPYSYWGVLWDPQPRMAAQALLPFLLLGAFRWWKSPRAWPLLALGASLLLYVHAVAGVVWGGALLVGFAATSLRGGRLGKHEVRSFLLAGMCFVGGALPFLLHYLGAHEHGRTALGYATVYGIMESRFRRGYFDIPVAVARLIAFWGESYVRMGFAFLGLGGVLCGFRRLKGVGDPDERLRLITVWIMAVLAISIGVPLVEQSIGRVLELLPTQVDLIRGVRFAIPLLLLAILIVLRELPRCARHINAGIVSGVRTIDIFFLLSSFAVIPFAVLDGLSASVGGTLFGMAFPLWVVPVISAVLAGAALLGSRHIGGRGVLWMRSRALGVSLAVLLLISWGIAHWDTVRLQFGGPSEPRTQPVRQLLDAVAAHVPTGSLILPTVHGLGIRYVSLRPVVYAFKDGGILAYSNHVALIEWDRRRQLVQTALTSGTSEDVLRGLEEAARSLGASYLVVDVPLPERLEATMQVVWRMDQYALLRLQPVVGSDEALLAL